MSVSTQFADAAPPAGVTQPPAVDSLTVRAPGVQLLGAYEGSGFRENHFLAVRPDGQVVHLSTLLYLVLSELSPGRTAEDVSRVVSAQLDRQLTADGVNFLMTKKLAPNGLLAVPDSLAGNESERTGPNPGSMRAADRRPDKPRANPLLALRLHRVLLSERVTQAIADALKVLFRPVVITVVVVGLLASDIMLASGGAMGHSLTAVVTQPILMLAVLGLLLSGTLFHELGHAAGCRYGGGNPGVIGVGVYVIVPAFYTNVTDAYRLKRSARLRTDLGGVYFNGIAALIFGCGYALTGWAPLLLATFLMHLEALQQLLPLIRSDGYFILADLVGVPDLFGRIRPILTSLLPWKPPGPRVRELRPSARIVISAWVLVVVPVLGVALYFLILQTPTLVMTTAASVVQQWDGLLASVGSGEWAAVVLGAASILLLLIPMAGLSVFLVQLTLRLIRLIVALFGRVRKQFERRPSGRHAVAGRAHRAVAAASRPGSGRHAIQSVAVTRPIDRRPPGATNRWRTQALGVTATVALALTADSPAVSLSAATEPETVGRPAEATDNSSTVEPASVPPEGHQVSRVISPDISSAPTMPIPVITLNDSRRTFDERPEWLPGVPVAPWTSTPARRPPASSPTDGAAERNTSPAPSTWATAAPSAGQPRHAQQEEPLGDGDPAGEMDIRSPETNMSPAPSGTSSVETTAPGTDVSTGTSVQAQTGTAAPATQAEPATTAPMTENVAPTSSESQSGDETTTQTDQSNTSTDSGPAVPPPA